MSTSEVPPGVLMAAINEINDCECVRPNPLEAAVMAVRAATDARGLLINLCPVISVYAVRRVLRELTSSGLGDHDEFIGWDPNSGSSHHFSNDHMGRVNHARNIKLVATLYEELLKYDRAPILVPFISR